MADTERTANGVSMSKLGGDRRTGSNERPARPVRPGRPPRAPRPDVPKIAWPRTIDYAAVAAGIMVLALWVRALSLLGYDGTLFRYAIHVNETAKSKDLGFDPDKYVHSIRVSAFITAVLLTAVMVLILGAMRRTRSASASRWGLLILLVLIGMPYSVVPVWGLPAIPQAAGVVSGVGAIAAIVLVFVPASARYFRECRDALVPPELRGQPRPGLGSLFKPRPPGGAAGARTAAARSAAAAPARPAATRASSSRAKAKVRSDAEAVAKGAELARSRAKTGKSRPTN